MRDWRKNSFRDFLRRLLLLGESPHRTALAFATGVFLAFSPFWGLHTTLGLAAAFVFRLNRVAVLIGVWTNTPWTLGPTVSLGTALGLLLMGNEVRFPNIPPHSLFSTEFWRVTWGELGNLFWPFFIGNTALSVIAALTAYFVIRWVVAQNAKRSTHR